MAKVVFRFFEIFLKDDDVVTFVKKMEEILKKFAGSAYHFRYTVEEPPNATRQKLQKESLEAPSSPAGNRSVMD